ncbi:MAG TPA: hypothetical protein PKE64_22040 [Anaerolineae bacterium]|nr:hypothetical protein [Anaerolineae bacterium]
MKIITLGIGLLLLLLGVGSYVLSGGASVTALIPALFGLGIAGLGGLALASREPHSRAQFGAVLLAILGLLGSLRGVASLFTLLTGGQVERPGAVVAQALMAGLCLLLIVLAVWLIKDFWQGWKAFGHFLGDLLARVVLTIFYFTVFVPFAIGVRLFSDPLLIKSLPAEFWRARTTGDRKLEEVLRQF